MSAQFDPDNCFKKKSRDGIHTEFCKPLFLFTDNRDFVVCDSDGSA